MGLFRDAVGSAVSSAAVTLCFGSWVLISSVGTRSIPDDLSVSVSQPPTAVWHLAVMEFEEESYDEPSQSEPVEEAPTEVQVAEHLPLSEPPSETSVVDSASVEQPQPSQPDNDLSLATHSASPSRTPSRLKAVAQQVAVGGPPPIATKRPRKKGRRRCTKTYSQIRKVGQQHYLVDRSLIRTYTRSIKAFNSLGYSHAYHKEDVRGWRVGGFGCNDVLYAAGLRGGDVLLSVNGKRTRNLVQIFWLYQAMKSKKHYEVKLLRRGKEMTFTFDVRKA